MALTKERPTKSSGRFTHHHEQLVVEDAVKIYKGALVALYVEGGTAGEVAPGKAATGMLGLGRATKTVDNADDGETIEVEAGEFWWKNSNGGDAIGPQHIGSICYIVDDETVAATDGTGTRSPAGKVVDVHSVHGVLVLSHAAVYDPSLEPTGLATSDDRRIIYTERLPLDADGVFRYAHSGADATIVALSAVVSGATTTTEEDATIEASIDGTPVSTGLITIPGGSAAGTVVKVEPDDDNVLADGDVLELTVTDGSQVAAAFANVTIELAR